MYAYMFNSWRWLFIIDGIITLPLAVIGYIFFPNLPQEDNKTWWTTQAEHELSVRRMKAVGRAGREPWSWPKFKRLLLSWHTYVLRSYPLLSMSVCDPADHQTQQCCMLSGTTADSNQLWATG